ncbi:MAG: tetratricopeptide repeat protein [Euryarchaeota archaeon]|nr:tetratricopeptide repeat protein [Euryarchaeota archaeon]MBU4608357.1 tetratricopeptide repeat protein [Euryarchaeota archaeon]MBV1729572.1 tetratricopeptide repeat protein [Methanobacterium sp.]MBV1754125.1 tetratricopeptide repeat protein [Methanobacterium sp.]
MEKEADNYFNQGYTYYEDGEPEKALEHYQEALEIIKATENHDKIGNIFLEMGNSYAAIKDCDKSLKMYQSCQEHYQKAKNHQGEGYALANIGVIQTQLGDYQKARDSYKKSIKNLKKSGDGSQKEIESLLEETYQLQKKDAQKFYEKAIRLLDKGKNKEAMGFYKKALQLFTDKSSRGDCLLEMGNIQAFSKNDEKALELYHKSQKEYHGPKDRLGEGFALANIGVIHDKRKEYEEARHYYQKALYKFEKAGDTESYNEISALMGESYQVQGAYGDALKHHQAYLEKFPTQHHPAGIHKEIDSIKDKLSLVKPTRNESLILLSYLLILIGAEVVTTYTNVEVGLLLHTIILFGLLINSSLSTNYTFTNLLRSMMALPMIRIVGLSIPIMNIPALYWFPIISVPLFAASVVIIRAQKLTLKSVGLVWGKIPLQIVVALTGVGLGLIEYMILRPDPLIPVFNPYYLILGASFMIISTGLAEELLFRGIVQKNAENIMGGLMSVLYVSLLFTSLHIGWESLLDLIFVFSVSMFYGFVFYKTRSIFGITLSHGISNSFLFLVFPFLL